MKRHFIYVPGFDLQRPEKYRALMARELETYCATRGVEAVISKRAQRLAPRSQFLKWTIFGRQDGQEIETEVTFFGWRDLVTRSFTWSPLKRIPAALGTFTHMTTGGFYRRQWRHSKPRAVFTLYPFIALLLLLLVAAAPTLALLTLPHSLSGISFIVALGVALLWAPLAYRLSRRIEPKTYFWYLVNDIIEISRLARDRDPEMTARIEEFATRIVDLVKSAAPEDEIIIAGHSSGGPVAVYALGRALEMAPNLGAGVKANITLLTLGSAHGYFGHFGKTEIFSKALEKVAKAPRIDWIDIYAPQDILCNGRINPVHDFVAPFGKRKPGGPIMQSACLPDAFLPETLKEKKKSSLEFHFSYLHATEIPGQYDFYEVLTSPDPWAWLIKPAPGHRRAPRQGSAPVSAVQNEPGF